MFWVISIALNTVIAGAFAMIAYTVFNGLRTSGQLRSNMLGVATGAMFASCALSHEIHAFHMLEPYFGFEPSEGLAMRRSIDWHLDATDALTMIVALWYWTQRPKFKALLDGGELFADLERRFADQTRALEIKGRVADILQRELAPKALPVASAVTFDAAYVPAEDAATVGGDWYDVFALPDGRIAFSIGDVTGHGLEAAILTSKAREALASSAFSHDAPGDVVARANTVLTQRDVAVITAIFGTIDPRSLELAYATAGHPPPVFASRDGSAAFGAYDGLALGIDAAATYPTFRRTLARGDLAVFYTDGVIEFSRDIAAGEALLLAAVGRSAAETLASPSRTILRDVIGRALPADDIAMLAISFIGDPVVVERDGERVWTFDVKNAAGATVLRRELATVLAARAPQIDLESSELIIGELLGNVVKHTPGTIVASLRFVGDGVVLAVSDRGPQFTPDARLPGDVYAEGGRGTYLVHALARDVRHAADAQDGNRIEVDLPHRRAAALLA